MKRKKEKKQKVKYEKTVVASENSQTYEERSADKKALPVAEERFYKSYSEAVHLFESNDIKDLSRSIMLLENIVSEIKDKLNTIRRAEEEKQRKIYRSENRCQYCGGKFKGLFSKTCKSCGRKKDY